MKIALISDIHGNDVALEAVLSDIAKRGVDQLICLGDVISFGPQPLQVLERLFALNCPCILGNHDEDFICPEPVSELDDWGLRMTEWCAAQLSATDLAYLSSFHSLLPVPLEGGKTLLCCHASPRNNQEFLLSHTPDDELNVMLDGHWQHTAIAFGHNHTQMLRLIRRSMLIGVGSVGYPIVRPWVKGQRVRTVPWCEYALIHSQGENISVEFCRIPMNLAAAKDAARRSGMPGLNDWLTMWLSEAV
jgi:predicted phosphodiesterase